MPRHEREEGAVDERELGTGGVGRVLREDREQREDAHLQEHEQSGPAVLAPVQLDVQGAVDPGNPQHREDHRELREAAQGDVVRQPVRRAGDDRDVDEVVEQLQVADGSIFDDLPVRPRRRSQPALELTC